MIWILLFTIDYLQFQQKKFIMNEYVFPILLNLLSFINVFIFHQFLVSSNRLVIIVTSLLESCTKSEPTSIIKVKGLKIIDKYLKDDFVFAYTRGVQPKSVGWYLLHFVSRIKTIGVEWHRKTTIFEDK
ncbi:UNVERIFIED_CONTAM: hypothetical protein NCL1_52577 [Trichonephila clavipes]